MSVTYITPPELAQLLKVKPSTVLTWIRSGELNAINVARRGAVRPRFRISPEAVSAWESSRSTATKTTHEPAAGRKRQAESVGQFY